MIDIVKIIHQLYGHNVLEDDGIRDIIKNGDTEIEYSMKSFSCSACDDSIVINDIGSYKYVFLIRKSSAIQLGALDELRSNWNLRTKKEYMCGRVVSFL